MEDKTFCPGSFYENTKKKGQFVFIRQLEHNKDFGLFQCMSYDTYHEFYFGDIIPSTIAVSPSADLPEEITYIGADFNYDCPAGIKANGIYLKSFKTREWEFTPAPSREDAQLEIGDIGNYYGGLNIKSEAGKFYWGIENYDGIEWSEISEKLYDTILEES